MILFAVIDVIGSIPVIIGLKQKVGDLNANKASAASLGIMVVFMFVGESILNLIELLFPTSRLPVHLCCFSFARNDFRNSFVQRRGSGNSVCNAARVSVVGRYRNVNYASFSSGRIYDCLNPNSNCSKCYCDLIVLKNISRLEKLLGIGGIAILRKVFGIILLAIAVKLFRTHTGMLD